LGSRDKVKREVTITADGIVNIEAAIEPYQESEDVKQARILHVAKDLLNQRKVLKMDP